MMLKKSLVSHIVLARSKYALEQLLSIIIVDDYEDLSNHATEAMGEIGLFFIAQVTSQSSTLFFVNISSH